MKKSTWVVCLLMLVLGCLQSGGQVNVTTWHDDNWRTGQNTNETILKKSSFNNNGFGSLCKISLPSSPQQEQVYAQPLVVTNNDGSMNVYVATMQDNLYVFTVPKTWNTNLGCGQVKSQKIPLLRGQLAGQFPADVCFIGNGPVGDTCSGTQPSAICPSVGVLGTPVIDTASNTMYLITESQDVDNGKQQGVQCNEKSPPNHWYHYLHALDLTSSSLTEKNGGPVLINPPIQGNATFKSQQLLQRPGLLFLPPAPPPFTPIAESVYAGFSMMDGTHPNPSGWALAWDGGNLGLGPWDFATVQNLDTKQGLGGGIWQGGAGLAAGLDANQNTYIYVSTADGQFRPGGSNYGDSFLKLDAELNLSDYFTPADAFYRWDATCGTQDLDLGSAGEMLVPDGLLKDSQYGNIVIKGDKEQNIWVIDRTSPGKSNACVPGNCNCSNTDSNVIQKFPITGTMARSAPAFWYDGTTPFMYVAQQYTVLQQYKLDCGYPNGPICSPAASTTPNDPAATGAGYAATPSVSSNGNLNNGTGIVWAVKGQVTNRNHPGLYAFDAENLNTVLFQPSTCPTRDAIGPTRLPRADDRQWICFRRHAYGLRHFWHGPRDV